MTSILGYKGEGNRTNESYLEANQTSYDEFAYQMGLAYYFYYEKDGNPQMSKVWLETAAESDKLENHQVERAKILAEMAGYDASLKSMGKSNKTGDREVTYQDYWNGMMELISGKNLVEQDNSQMALVMYKNFVYQIYNYTLQFKAAGITEEELNDELDKVETRLNTDIVVVNEDDRSEIENTTEEILDLIERARENVALTYSNNSADLAGQSGGETDAGTGTVD